MEKMSHDKNLFDRIEDLKTIQEHERIILNFNRGIFDRNKAIEALLKFKAAHIDYTVNNAIDCMIFHSKLIPFYELSDYDLVLNLDLQLLYLTGKYLMKETFEYIQRIKNYNQNTICS